MRTGQHRAIKNAVRDWLTACLGQRFGAGLRDRRCRKFLLLNRLRPRQAGAPMAGLAIPLNASRIVLQQC